MLSRSRLHPAKYTGASSLKVRRSFFKVSVRSTHLLFYLHLGQSTDFCLLRSRRQHERSAQRHYCYRARWSSQPFGPGLHTRKPRAIFHCTGYVEVCPESYLSQGAVLHFGVRTGWLTTCSDRNAPMFRSRGTRGRGVGLARGRATVNRARGQRGGRGGG